MATTDALKASFLLVLASFLRLSSSDLSVIHQVACWYGKILGMLGIVLEVQYIDLLTFLFANETALRK